MFLRYFIELPLPAEAMERALLLSPAEWLPHLADQAGQRGEDLLAEVGIGPPNRGLRKQVRIHFGPVVRYPSRTTLRPPLGAVGRAIDRALLHQVAEATVKGFLDQTGQAIQRLVDQQPCPAY